MSGDSFKPEEGGEVEVINPDKGNSEIDAQPADGDAMDAAESEAMEAFTSIDDEATEEEVEAEEVVEDPQPVEDQSELETPVEESAEEVQIAAWDGNPDNLPEELQATYQTMLRGFHQKTTELAGKRRETEDLNAKLTLRLAGDGEVKAEAEGPPLLPSGDGITQEQWNEAVTKQNQWYADRNLKKMEESGHFVSKEDHMKAEREAFTDKVVAEVESLDGYNQNVQEYMLTAMSTDPFWASAPNSREGMMALADKAIKAVGVRVAVEAKEAKAIKKTVKQSTAGTRATPRFSTPKGASAEDVFASTGFKSEDARMEAMEREAADNFGE